MKQKEIGPLLDEPACEHNGKSKSGRARPKPGATAGGCAFDGAQIALLPIADVAHIVHGPIACAGSSWDNCGTRSSGPALYRIGMTTDLTEQDVIMGGGEKRLLHAIKQAIDGYAPAAVFVHNTCVPAFIGLPTTGLSETQGSDVRRAVHGFREARPGFAGTAVVPVATPDFNGCLESGFALAVDALIDSQVPDAGTAGTAPGRRPEQINVLASSMLTPGDIEAVKETVEAFGLRPVVVPDVGDALDGHLDAAPFSPLTTGGTPVAELATLGAAAATLVVGASLAAAADRLHALTGVPDHRFDTLMGLAAVARQDRGAVCRGTGGVITPELVARAAARGIGPEAIAALRAEWPGIHFTHGMEDNVSGGRPVAEGPGFAVYLVGGDHCLGLTTDHAAASGMLFAEAVVD